jgi:aminoglycoside 3-N-acetyltransferase
MKMQSYSERSLRDAYEQLGIGSGDLIYVAGNLLNLGFPPVTSREEILRLHHDALRAAVGESGTLVVPTYTFSLCNTDKVFDVDATPSEVGPITEYIRLQPGAVRQFHPFSSKTAVGPLARDLCADCSRHANGGETPFPRMCDANCKIVSIGLEPARVCSVVHHVELEMGVPYRYVKEFQQPVVRNGKIGIEPFYLYVVYRECDLDRGDNKRIIQHFRESHPIREVRVGAGFIYTFSMPDLVTATRKLMEQDIYCYLNTPPLNRPYRH